MGVMLLPIAVVLLAGLLVLGAIVSVRYPVSTWGRHLRALRSQARPQEPQDVRIVPQDASLMDFVERGETSSYLGTESFSGLVTVVEKTMTVAEARTQGLRRTLHPRA